MATNRLQAGQRYGRLTVSAVLPRIGNNRMVICQCDCGEKSTVYQSSLSGGRTTSCGCWRSQKVSALRTTHGESGNHYQSRRPSVEYKCWKDLKARCTNPKDPRYLSYGARGISVCDRWQSFEAFLEDMGRRPSNEHSIDRKNNDGNYEPGNCRWATIKEQNSNTRRNKFVVLNGERLVVAEAIRRVGIKSSTFWQRVKYGWTPEQALTQEVRHRY